MRLLVALLVTLAVVLVPASASAGTYRGFTTVWGFVFLSDGTSAPVGTAVQLLNPAGEIVSQTTVKVVGELPVLAASGSGYWSTPGFVPGEPIRFTVEGNSAHYRPQIIWQEGFYQRPVVLNGPSIEIQVSGTQKHISLTADVSGYPIPAPYLLSYDRVFYSSADGRCSELFGSWSENAGILSWQSDTPSMIKEVWLSDSTSLIWSTGEGSWTPGGRGVVLHGTKPKPCR